jgi:RimJ/RimL family protein N-acetyltransferase
MIVPESFSTTRLFLRRSKESDAPAIFEYGSDPEVARYADWPKLTSVDDAQRSVENARSPLGVGGLVLMAHYRAA